LLVAERRRRIERARRIEALDQIPKLQIRIDSEAIDLKSISAVAEKHDLSTYDAAYLELALRRGLGLVTLDRDLAQAGNSEGVSVQSPGRSGAAQRRRRYNV
jgi:predicted nucleic acid-binding protein